MHSFVLSHTKPTRLELLPSIRLYLADEVIPVWERSEREAPPFWAFAWAGGQALARYLLDNPSLIRGRQVLDLASGSGLVAIAAAQCGACAVLATEIDEYAIEAIGLNAALNGVSIETHLGDILSAHCEGDILSVKWEGDVILAGDVFYSREMAGRVLSFLEGSKAELILVGDPGRGYAPQTGFEAVAEYDVPANRDIEDADVKRAHVLQLHGLLLRAASGRE